jgi:surface antigen
MRQFFGGACLAAMLSTGSTVALAAFPVFDQRPLMLEISGPARPDVEKERVLGPKAAAPAAIILAGGPPPWAPAHGYRKKHGGKAEHYDDDHHHHHDDHHRVDLPDLGIDRGFCNRELVGGILGGVAGGAIGSQIGDGDTRIVTTIGGTIAGVLIGGAIGRRMDDADHACVAHALAEGPTGQPVVWSAPRGDRYRIVPDAFYRDDRGRLCRDFRTMAFIDGRERSRKGTACRVSDGAWHEVS